VRRLDRSAIDQQQMVAGLAASGVQGVAQLGFVPAAEGIQMIQQDGDAEAAPARLGLARSRRVRGRPRRICAHVCRRPSRPWVPRIHRQIIGELVAARPAADRLMSIANRTAP
jgi:hypothetical protein